MSLPRKLRRRESSFWKTISMNDMLLSRPAPDRSTNSLRHSHIGFGGHTEYGGSPLNLSGSGLDPHTYWTRKLNGRGIIDNGSDKPRGSQDAFDVHGLERLYTVNHTVKRRTPFQVISELVTSGKIEPNEPDNFDNSILALAVQYQDNKLVEFLLDHGATPSESGAGVHESVITLSAIVGDLEHLNKFLEIGSVDGTHALHEAVYHSNYKVVKALLDANADPNGLMTEEYAAATKSSTQTYIGAWRSSHGLSRPLHIAVMRAAYTEKLGEKKTPRNGSVSIVSLLIARGADLTLKDDAERTPLDLLADGDDKDIVEILWCAIMP